MEILFSEALPLSRIEDRFRRRGGSERDEAAVIAAVANRGCKACLHRHESNQMRSEKPLGPTGNCAESTGR
jgi:hypothetical protein